MGNLDRWSTPKGIKIERAGNPRPLRRGFIKKSERKKGRKARLDEIVSQWKKHRFWMDRIEHYEQKDKFDVYWVNRLKGWSDTHLKQYRKLRASFVADFPDYEATILKG